MQCTSVYDFLFHPCSPQHSDVYKVFSIATIVALTVITAGGFLFLFGYRNWQDHNIIVQTQQSDVISSISLPILNPKIRLIKQEHSRDLERFERWAAEQDWKQFTPKYSHYDWWMFPIMRPSQQKRDTYAVSTDDINALKMDKEFMKNYRRGIELVVASWGWDLARECPIENACAGQCWDGYGVRLGKMAESLYLFDETKELYRKLQLFYRVCCLPQIARFPLQGWVVQALSKDLNSGY